jgi:hypothetical protein
VLTVITYGWVLANLLLLVLQSLHTIGSLERSSSEAPT